MYAASLGQAMLLIILSWLANYKRPSVFFQIEGELYLWRRTVQTSGRIWHKSNRKDKERKGDLESLASSAPNPSIPPIRVILARVDCMKKKSPQGQNPADS